MVGKLIVGLGSTSAFTVYDSHPENATSSLEPIECTKNYSNAVSHPAVVRSGSLEIFSLENYSTDYY